MSRLIYFVRHGQTYFNESHRLQGRCDAPLTDLGQSQVRECAAVLQNHYFDQVFCSPMGRTRQTAEILLKDREIHPHLLEDLQEVDLGELDGQVVEENAELRACFETLDFSRLRGESRESLKARVTRVFQYLLSNTKEDDRILLISHGVLGMAILYLLMEDDFQSYQKECSETGKAFLPNAGIFLIREEQGKLILSIAPTVAKSFPREVEDKIVHLYYVRHGQTLFNLRRQAQGRCDSLLTEKGREQAKHAGLALAQVPFVRAYVSYSRRAMDTASLILENRLVPISIEKDLQEMHFGSLEGTKMDETGLEIFYRCHENGEDFSFYGGETLAEVNTRWKNVLTKIYREAKSEDSVLLVGHGTMYMILLSNLLGRSRKEVEEYCRKQGLDYSYNGGIARFDLSAKGLNLISLMRDPKAYSEE